MKKYLLVISLIFASNICIQTQQTIGLFYNTPESYNGYTLFAPMNSKTTYLIDNCGEVVNSWESEYTPGASVYLSEHCLLFRTGKKINKDFAAGGSGGIIEVFDWDGKVVWDYSISSSTHSLHHDIELMPNGNILALVWKAHTKTEAILAGRKTTPDILWSEEIVEIKPHFGGEAEIVWRWDSWDHTVQDQASQAENFGDVTSPALIDINFSTRGFMDSDWLHFNSIDYNPELDQILISNHNFSEIWIIDHSTTTEEAASHSGGNSGMGGDLMYRWGNPIAYGSGDESSQKLFLQHDPHWIKQGLKDEGKILLFNNRAGIPDEKEYSTVNIIDPPMDDNNNYIIENSMYGPIDFDWTYPDIPDTNFYGRAVSGAQRLPNGNTLICNGWEGDIFEIDSNKNKVWLYVSPTSMNGREAAQGEMLNDNQIFRADRYRTDYPGLVGKDLTPKGYIESGSDFTCQIFDGTTNTVERIDDTDIQINYRNNQLDIQSVNLINTIEIYNLSGNKIVSQESSNRNISITTHDFTNGIYLVRLLLDNGKPLTFKILSK